MPSHLLKSAPVDVTPPVVALPPHIVEFEVDGMIEHIDIHQPIPVYYVEEEESPVAAAEDASETTPSVQNIDPEPEETPPQEVVSPGKGGKRGGKHARRSIKKSERLEAGKNGEARKTPARKTSKLHSDYKKLPEARFKIIDDYNLDDAPARPNNAYIRYIERTSEELAEIVEYDLDEEDFAWLELVNEKRATDGYQAVLPEIMEFIMDKLEKESYFQMQSAGMEQGPIIDDDAVCCICMDGECQNANAILFCDMCNLAVHQECYGVPYIPEGQWLCRRCLLSPSIAVDCVLCPNKGGAFKETECKRWAHVVCAIWIPEVCFANTVFLEPIDNVGSIPQARWRLQCYICKQKSVGACIQCYKSNCYTAFHVTCAQQAGLCMRMETVRLSSGVTVKKTAWCDLHAPPDFIAERDSGSSTARQKLKQIRKMLAEKRCAPPVLSIPTIPSDQMTQISSAVSFPRKKEFIRLLTSYWKLKRMSRNGVPLLRRLQVAANTGSIKSSRKLDLSQATMQQYQDAVRLRQDLERGRLLCELTRKREKLKREQIYTKCNEWDLRIQPFNFFLSGIIDDLQSKDSQEIFTQPVDPLMVPDYLNVVKNPMDLSTMRKKIFDFEYRNIDDLEVDFKLMINNCLLYNSPDTVFYRFALKMQEYGGIVFREAKRKHELIGFDMNSGLMQVNPPPQYLQQPDVMSDGNLTAEIDAVLNDKSRFDLTFEDHLNILEQVLDKSVHLNHPVARKKRFIRIKNEIVRLKKRKRLSDSGAAMGAAGGDVSSMDEYEVAPSPSIFGFESSDAGEEGEPTPEANKTPTFASVLRRRLRSTEASYGRQKPKNQIIRISRRLSKSSEPPLKPIRVHVPPPHPGLISGTNTSVVTVAIDAPVAAPRKRGRPPKALSQRGRGRHLQVTTRGSPSPLRQTSFSASSKRGAFRGRPGRPRGRRVVRPIRRSDRVVKQQMLAQQQKEGQTESQKESRRTSPRSSRNSSPKNPNVGGGSRHASPVHQPITQKAQSVRNVSPVSGSPMKLQHKLPAHVQQGLSMGSSIKSQQKFVINRQQNSILGPPLKSPKMVVNRQTSPPIGYHVKSPQKVSTNRQPSPTLGSPLKSHPVKGGANHQVKVNATLPTKTNRMRSVASKRHNQASPVSPPKPRPVRERAAKLLQQNNAGSHPNNVLASRSMEAAAKSIVCEERSPKKPMLQGGVGIVSTSPGNKLKMKRIHGASPNISTRGANANQVVRQNSLNYNNFMVDSTSSQTYKISPGRKIKGPAGAVGRRKKSTSELNGPSNPYLAENSEETEKRKLLFPPTNGIPLVTNSTNPKQLLTTAVTSPKKRPRRNAASSLAPNANLRAGLAYNNTLSESSSGSLYQNHHHHHASGGLHVKKMDSFSVYRSGGNHEINSGEEYDSEESTSSEGEDSEEETEEQEEEEKSESEDEEDEDEDNEEKTTQPKGREEDEEEESEEENSSDDGQEGDSSDSDNSSDSDSDSSSTSSSTLSSTNSGSTTATSSSITTPRHLFPGGGKKFRTSNYNAPRQRRHSAQNPVVASTPSNTITQPTKEASGGPTIVRQQLASPSLASNHCNNNNNNNVLCSNKEKEKHRKPSGGGGGGAAADPRGANTQGGPSRRAENIHCNMTSANGFL